MIEKILPSNWKWRSLGELSSAIQYGYTAKAEPEPIGPKLLRITDIQNDTVNWKDVPFCQVEDAEKEKYLLGKNDLVFARTGATVGKSYLVSGSIPQTVFASYLIRVRLRDEVSPKYVAYFFKSADYWHQISVSQAGIGQPNVNGKKLAQIRIPIAPFEKQQQIVAEIEKQFSRLDEAVASLKRVKANLKRDKAAVLKAAVEGRLVLTEAELASREGRSYETGDQLLRRTLGARRSQSKGMFIMPAGPIVRELPELPEGWIWVSAIQACDPVIDCHNKTAPYINAGIPLVRTTNIRDGRVVLEDLRYVDQPTYEYWSRRCPPQPGDVLFTREAPMGEAGIIPPRLQLCLGQRTMLMRPSSAISAEFLLASLMSPVVKGLIDRVAVGSGVKHLRVGDVERLPIPLPPLVEQHRITAEVDRRLSVIEKLDAVVGANLTRADRLRHSILHQAFSGQLACLQDSMAPASLRRVSRQAGVGTKLMT